MKKLIVGINIILVVVIIALGVQTILFDMFLYADGENILFTIIDVARVIMVIFCSMYISSKHSATSETVKVLLFFTFISVFGYYYYSLWVAIVGIIGSVILFINAKDAQKNEFSFNWK